MFYKQNTIPLFWWSTKKFHKISFENFGDIIGPYLIKKITGKTARFIHPKKRKWYEIFTNVYVTSGSILAQIDKNCIVWGSGLIEKSTKVPKAIFLAVRGPLTRQILLKQGCTVPEIYGDPALLLPMFYSPKKTKTHTIGIIPHYVDYQKVSKWYENDTNIKVVNLLNNNVEEVINEILFCENIVSSSLHGIIVPQAYDIPSAWVKFSDKIFGDNIKFYDYFESVGLPIKKPFLFKQKLSENELLDLVSNQGMKINKSDLAHLQNDLFMAFKNYFFQS